jgi:MYXO-CTERM domain-containing protein
VSDQCVGGDAGNVADSGGSGPDASVSDSGPSGHRADAGSDAGTDANGIDAGGLLDALSDSPVALDASSADAGTSPVDSGPDPEASLAAPFDSAFTEDATGPAANIEAGDEGTGDAARPAGCGCRTASPSPQSGGVGAMAAGLLLARRRRRPARRGTKG